MPCPAPRVSPVLASWLLTLQFLVAGLPLQADGQRTLVDEAPEAGVLARPHCAAGRVNGDDGTAQAWVARGESPAQALSWCNWLPREALPAL